MKTKRVREFIDTGFGFPIILEGVQLVMVRGVWTPKVNHNLLEKEVLRQLMILGGRLTGNQIKFIRLYFDMPLAEFGARFGVSHVAALKWEKKGNKLSGMAWGIEKDIRLFIHLRIAERPKDLFRLYEQLELAVPEKVSQIILHMQKLAA